MASKDSINAAEPGIFYLYSHKPPEEASIFGFQSIDIEDMWAPVEEEAPASPDDWGFTSTNKDGICKYCQLMLYPRAPGIIKHQPNMATLIASNCPVCKWIEVSIVQGSPQLALRWHQEDPAIRDPNSTSCEVTIGLEKKANYTRAVATVSERNYFADKGVPLNITTRTQLGELFLRRFWKPHDPENMVPNGKRLEILKTWLDECRLNHKNCSAGRPDTGVSKLPTRVLELTGSLDKPSTEDDIKIRLRETSEEERGRYTALSYCWGEDEKHHFKTTKQNLERHKHGIDPFDIPLTHREAILATLSLGIRYLWIDSLCIIQDSSEDWEKEAATMNEVYSNAVLTLAATFSHNPTEGLLNPLQCGECVTIHGDLATVRLETHTSIDAASEPLNTRAWTLQEAFLSPRMISFGSEQWLWRCASRYATEDGLVDRPQQAKDCLNYWYGINHQAKDDNSEYMQTWYRLVANYSRRQLTYEKDKLKAIAGLVNMFAKQTGYEFVAGLWAEDIANGLMWQATSRGVRREAGTMPSWSWASVSGPVLIPTPVKRSSIMIDLLKVEQEWQGEPVTSSLKVARLHIRGAMMKASLGQQSVSQRLRYHLMSGPQTEEIFGEAYLDNLDPVEQGINDVHCLHVHSGFGENGHFMLLLLPAQDESLANSVEVYRRIGFAVMLKKSKFTDRRGGHETLREAWTTDIVLV